MYLTELYNGNKMEKAMKRSDNFNEKVVFGFNQ